ncbi:polyketide synthase PksD [Xylariomycetidae sp. FL2044]|nr:polyketide synthase PksD [Xylariomycetidae sp. FL2044]
MEPIAIIGFSFKFPQGIEDEGSFWDVLSSGKNVMTAWPKSRTNIDAFCQPNDAGVNDISARGGYFLSEDPAAFDAPFFSIAPKEAEAMDPQQRWLLETSYRALENAGIPIEKVAGSDTAVFSSSMAEDYTRVVSRDPEGSPLATATGTTACMLANRISWYFDLKGPSLQINTACSSSMIATDVACQSLRSGQTSMALVTASNAMINPEVSIYLSKMGFLSPDGLCYSFDHRANGLRDAIKDGDKIRAVIRASGSNQDGHTPGLTQPSLATQEELIRQVYRTAGLDFNSTRYIEAHGKRSSFSRPFWSVLFKVRKYSLTVLFSGSVKSNIGHLEGCSGLAGILKSVMMLEKGMIPPLALFEKWNPKINAKAYCIEAPLSCFPWPSQGLRRISINSFGFGGSNGHIILDDALHTLEAMNFAANSADLATSTALLSNGNKFDLLSANSQELGIDRIANGEIHLKSCDGTVPIKNGTVGFGHSHRDETTRDLGPLNLESSTQPKLLVWTAKDSAGLSRMLRKYSQYFEGRSCGQKAHLDALAYTLAARRSILSWRAFAIANTENHIEIPSIVSSLKPIRSSRDVNLVFIFTGQGVQYPEMGLGLLCYPVFRSTLLKMDRIFQDLGAEWSLMDELRSGERIDLPQISQPLCTAVQIALIELLRNFNVMPDVVVGHSSGEIAAAYSIGALSIESSCLVAFHRGRLAGQLMLSSTNPGAMMSVNLSEQDAIAYISKLPILDGEIQVACINSPSNVTLSGDESAIDGIKEYLDQDGIFAQKVRTGVAYHSSAMNDISDEYLTCLGSIQKGDHPQKVTTMISSVTGLRVEAISVVASAKYWVENLVSQVRFVDALKYLTITATKQDGIKAVSDYVEVGPHSALQRPIKDCLALFAGGNKFHCQSVLSRKLPHVTTLMQMVGRLFVRGHPVSVTAVNQSESTPTSHSSGSLLVDTPEYPFDHSRLYWHESRLSRDWRLRMPAPRTTLGIPAADWNPLEPRWRKILSVDETPWALDHVIGGDIFFPATAMLAMAVEATKQMSDVDDHILGYHIKEATFMKPIVIKPEENTEVVTHLRSLQHTHEKSSSRFEVRLFVYGENRWGECFKAIIHAEHEEQSTEVDNGHESRMLSQSICHQYKLAQEASVQHFEAAKLYQWLQAQGLSYGKLFALAEGIYWDGGSLSTAQIKVPQVPGVFEGVIHPAVLDACCHPCVAAVSEGMANALPTMVPARLRNAWVSSKGWSQLKKVQTFSTSKLKPANGGIEASISVLTDDGLPLYHVEQFEMLPITGEESSGNSTALMVYGIDWRPQLSLMTPGQIRHHCESVAPSRDESQTIEYYTRLEAVLRATLRYNIKELLRTDWSQAPRHMQGYVLWLENQVLGGDWDLSGEITERDLDRELEAVLEKVPSWKLFAEVARNLVPLVRGDLDSHELIVSSMIGQLFYDGVYDLAWDDKMAAFLRLAAHGAPNQRILSIGSFTCGITGQLISTLEKIEHDIGGLAYSECVVVHDEGAHSISEGGHSGPGHSRIKFISTVDTNKYGFEPEAYDIIIVNNVLSPASHVRETLNDLHRALKPSGHLIIHDIVESNRLVTTLAFGILPSWWINEETYPGETPKISESAWDAMLKDHGFSGNDVVLRDFEDAAVHSSSLIISTAEVTPTALTAQNRVLVVLRDGHADFQGDVASSLAELALSSLPDHHLHVFSVAQLEDANVGPDDFVIWLADLDEPLLADLTVSMFDYMKDWVRKSQNLLWVTLTEAGENCRTIAKSSHSGLKDGFLRSIRSEFNDKHLISLSLEDESHDPAIYATSILKIFAATFQMPSPPPDVEYIVRDGVTLTGRLVVDRELDKRRKACLAPQPCTQPWNSGVPVKLDVAVRGSLESLRFVEDTDKYRPLGPSEVEIEAKAWGLNFRDVFIALGRLDEDDFGTDCAGIVTKVGPLCKDIRAGDRVCMCVTGCMRAYPRADELSVVRIPESVSYETACAIIGPAITSWHSLVEVARLKKGERVLIHAASGATGQLAIQIAKMLGAEILATVGYNHKKKLIADTYGIPDDHIFFSRNTTFAKGVMRTTQGGGVDVVLNSLVGEGLRASWECIAPYGRFVEIGKADIYTNTSLPMSCFAKNVSFSAVDLRHIMLHRPTIARGLLVKAMDLAQEGVISKPEPMHLYDICSVEDAFRYFQSGKNTGRTVIQINGEMDVEKHIVDRRTWSFTEDATYMVVGGLGGVGRLILRWMVSRGARHLIVPSRSAATSQPAIELVNGLTREGVTIITPRCDVSSEDSFSQMLEQYGKRLPPIRGCVNAAMALEDSTFDLMRHSQWEATVRSKAQTSWNLAKALPVDLDFLIFLASTTGVAGNVGAPNYAAGCTLQDSLATRLRARRVGDKSISMDLGVMKRVGVVAETVSLQKTLIGNNTHAIEDEDLLALLDVFCDPAQSTSRSQIVMGIPTPAEVALQGVEVMDMLQRPLFAHFGQPRSSSDGSRADSQTRPGALFRRAQTEEERLGVVVDCLSRKVARILSMEIDEVRSDKPLHVFGVDSLVAVELRNWMKNEFSAQLPIHEITGLKSIEVLGELVCRVSDIKAGILDKTR